MILSIGLSNVECPREKIWELYDNDAYVNDNALSGIKRGRNAIVSVGYLK